MRATELNATAVYGVAELDDAYGVELFFDAACVRWGLRPPFT